MGNIPSFPLTIKWRGKEYHYISRHLTQGKAEEQAKKWKATWYTHIVERVAPFSYGSMHMWSTRKMYYLYGRKKT